MLKLIYFTTALILFCVGAIRIAEIVGASEENPIAGWFTYPDGSPCPSPCLFGIQPGITSYEDAIRITSLHPVTRPMQRGITNLDSNNFDLGNGHFCLSIWRDKNDRVGTVVLTTHQCYVTPIAAPQTLTLGQLISILGLPSHLGLGTYGLAPDLYLFLNGRVHLESWNASNSCGLSPNENYDFLEILDYNGLGSSLPRWKGFGSRRNYARSDNEFAALSTCLN